MEASMTSCLRFSDLYSLEYTAILLEHSAVDDIPLALDPQDQDIASRRRARHPTPAPAGAVLAEVLEVSWWKKKPGIILGSWILDTTKSDVGDILEVTAWHSEKRVG